MALSYFRRVASSALTAALALFQSGFGAGQLFFDGGHAFGQRSDFLIQAEDFAVRLL